MESENRAGGEECGSQGGVDHEQLQLLVSCCREAVAEIKDEAEAERESGAEGEGLPKFAGPLDWLENARDSVMAQVVLRTVDKFVHEQGVEPLEVGRSLILANRRDVSVRIYDLLLKAGNYADGLLHTES